MSAVITQESAAAENRTLDLYRLRVEDYDKMIEYGIFGEDERVELLDGVLVKMSPKGVRHRTATTKTTDFFYEYLRQKAVIQVQDPIRLDDFSEPEPDIVLAKMPLSNYALRHPSPKDILLVVEVADTSVAIDRHKAQKYAENGIAQYLILNLNTNEIEEYREPSAEGYRFKKVYTQDENFNLVAFPDVSIKVSDLLLIP